MYWKAGKQVKYKSKDLLFTGLRVGAGHDEDLIMATGAQDNAPKSMRDSGGLWWSFHMVKRSELPVAPAENNKASKAKELATLYNSGRGGSKGTTPLDDTNIAEILNAFDLREILPEVNTAFAAVESPRL